MADDDILKTLQDTEVSAYLESPALTEQKREASTAAIREYVAQNSDQLNQDAYANDPSLATSYNTPETPYGTLEPFEPAPKYDSEGQVVDAPIPVPPARPKDLYPEEGPQGTKSEASDPTADDKEARANGTRDDRPRDNSESPVPNRETMALVQKGYYQQPGFYGNQALSNSNRAFENAVGTALGYVAVAQSLKALSEKKANTAVPRNKTSNYYLRDSEKRLIEAKAIVLSAPGVVPYDAIEDFLYILVSVDNFADLKYIATVVGINQLADPKLIRETELLLKVKDLNKISFLANAVAAINKTFASKYQSAYACADTSGSKFSSVLSAAAGGAAIASMAQFPGISMISSQLSSIVSSVASNIGTMALFNTISGLSGAAFDSAFSTISGLMGGLTSSFMNIGSELMGMVNSIIGFGINALNNIIGSIRSMVSGIMNLGNTLNQVAAFIQKPRIPDMMGDITKQFTKMFSSGQSILSGLQSIMSAVNSIAGPALSGFAMSQIFSKAGGKVSGNFLTEMTIGQRVPVMMLANNPMMQAPSYVSKAMFGESAVAVNTVDKDIVKRIGVFPSPGNGAGSMSFGMQNFGSFGGISNMTDIVAKVALGVSVAPTIGPMAAVVSTLAGNVGNLLGVSPTSSIELRRSDNSIPFMIAMGSALVDDTRSPFPTSTYQTGWKLAASTANDLQRHNGAFLQACTSL